MTAPEMVGRITDETTLPGGAVLLMKRARNAGGWFTWATGGWYAATSEPKPRVLVKGRHVDGRRFVVSYVDGKVHTAYVGVVNLHARATVAEVRSHIDGEVTT